MTQLLQQAFAKAQNLSDSEQNAIAQLMLEEIESDRLWERALIDDP